MKCNKAEMKDTIATWGPEAFQVAASNVDVQLIDCHWYVGGPRHLPFDKRVYFRFILKLVLLRSVMPFDPDELIL